MTREEQIVNRAEEVTSCPPQINTGEMILSKEECEKIRTAVLENKPEVVEEIVVDHAIEFLSKKIQQ